MIAPHGGLDHTRAVIDLAARDDLQDDVAGMRWEKRLPIPFRDSFCGPPEMPLDRLTDEHADLVFIHDGRSTISTMPTMAASTGAAFLPMASLAERPSSTISTFSPTPAPAPSTASSSPPRGLSSSVSGCTSSSLPPSSFGDFLVE